ncbi:hypothetical protein BUALT_Bualt06G0087400 [Buddleja alternifolia]|uniref:F-box protein n=1 Tax=Buddleja alternifolia TaxID=168488 RepID=A0AAV6XFB2_9LAMI|nr:hypothetical protein BUALT_Bualt06G0087400 [Buddleja alternifolia]
MSERSGLIDYKVSRKHFPSATDMEELPTDLCLKIFCWLDHHNLASAQLGQKWRDLASDDALWSNLFKERWGIDTIDSNSWKDVYIVQDRCDRVGFIYWEADIKYKSCISILSVPRELRLGCDACENGPVVDYSGDYNTRECCGHYGLCLFSEVAVDLIGIGAYSLCVELGSKIIREVDDYFLVHQGQIQRHLGSRRPESRAVNLENKSIGEAQCTDEDEGPCLSILDKILFFIGDMESASVNAKLSRLL